MLRKLRTLFHPIAIFVVAQISWALLMVVWIRWYIIRSQEIEIIVERLPINESFRTGNWIILTEGCILMAIILVGLYMIFVSFRKQVRLNKMQDSILSSVTHELKTPLASIRLYSETMLLRTLERQDQEKFLKRTLSETDRLQRLIDSVLISARIEVDKSRKSQQRVDIVEIIDGSWERVKERFGESRQLSYHKDVRTEDGQFVMHCNPHQICVLFDNLLDNAIKYTEPGGSIGVRVQAMLGKFQVEVKDDGEGIEKKELKKIFNKFYRVEHEIKRKVHGSGLGLFVCSSIVKAHAGRIYATSEGLGKGATFHVEFERNDTYR